MSTPQLFFNNEKIKKIKSMKALHCDEIVGDTKFIQLINNHQVEYELAKSEITALDLRKFEVSGWKFVNSTKSNFKSFVKVLKTNGGKLYDVYFTENNRAIIPTGQMIVKFNPNMTQSQVLTEMEKEKMVIVRKLGFGKHLFKVSFNRPVNTFGRAEKLKKNTCVISADPICLEFIGHR